jgi:TonB family protein
MMILESILVVSSFGAAAQLPTPPAPPQSPCLQALAVGADAAAGEICSGEEAERLASAAQKESTARTRQLDAAAGHYRRAVVVSSKVETKVRALDLLAQSYDAQHLNDPKQMEQALRERIRFTPDDLAPVYRLARLLEDEQFIDAAEETLLGARHQQPDAVEPNRMLAQFYARRVTALHKEATQKEPPAASSPGERDENGVYRVGGPVTPPSRLDVPRYPADASAAGIKGAVVAEVVIDASGTVTDAKVVQSIPLLDEAALQAVRNWRYAPSVVNGQPVPVRMTVTVNFSLPPSQPAPTPPRR